MNPAIDDAVFRRLAAAVGPDDVVGELVDVFISEAKARIEAMKSAIAGGDAAALSTAAHTLKGSSAALGAHALAALCARLETRDGALAPADADAVFGALVAEHRRVVADLAQRRAR